MKAIYLSALLIILAACGNDAETISAEVQQSASDSTREEEKGDVDDYDFVSEDGRVSIYVGESSGGSYPEYYPRWTIIDDKGEAHKLTFGNTSDIRGLHAIKKTDGTTYYIVHRHSSSAGWGQAWLEGYKIVGDTIKKVNAIDGGRKIDDKNFSIDFNVPNLYFATDGFGFGWILEYDNKTRNLYVPITKEMKYLDRYDVWHFNGNRFVRLGEQGHKDMHKSVGEYNRLILYCETKDYIVRVDSLDNHQLRYASWKRPKTMADQPDLVITGGKRHHYPVAPDVSGPCDDFRFKHGNYEYIVNHCESTPVSKGISEHIDYLVVKAGGKIIVKQSNE